MTPKRIQFALAVLAVAALHFATSFIAAFAGGISGGFARVLSHILLFPLSILSGPDSALWGWLLWALISLLWGLGICVLLRAILPSHNKV